MTKYDGFAEEKFDAYMRDCHPEVNRADAVLFIKQIFMAGMICASAENVLAIAGNEVNPAKNIYLDVQRTCKNMIADDEKNNP